MKWFKNLFLRTKLLFLSVFSTLILSIVGYYGISSIQSISKDGQALYNNDVIPMEIMQDISLNFLMARIEVRDAYLCKQKNDIDGMAAFHSSAVGRLEKVTHDLARLKSTLTDEEDVRLYTKIENEYKKFTVIAGGVVSMTKDGNLQGVSDEVLTNCIPAGIALKAALENLMKHKQQQAKSITERGVTSSAALTKTTLAISIAGTLTLLIISFIISRVISFPLKTLCSAAQSVTEGDTSVRVNVNTTDEIGILSLNFNSMVEQIATTQQQTEIEKTHAQTAASEAQRLAYSAEEQSQYLNRSVENMLQAMSQFSKGDLTARLPVEGTDVIARLFQGFNIAVENIRSMVCNVRNAAESAAASGIQIKIGTEHISSGAGEQSVHVTDVAAAIEEMSSTINDNAQLATRTSDIAQKSRDVALSSGIVIRESIHKVQEIAHSVESVGQTVETLGTRSKEIGDIVSVIKEIADQTNLLALNAAIEAARAGEQGRGFAVVADEVRKLSERTQSSTKEIEIKISAIQHETDRAVDMMGKSKVLVQEGISLSDQAGASLETIVKSVEEVVDTVTTIAAASEEQATTSNVIARNVDTIRNASREMAQGLGDVASASANLNDLTWNLQNLMAQFKLSDNSNSTLIHNNQYRNNSVHVNA
ncbi:MAG: methyl-accepting chemotaxis protein [Candidatus Kapabacteria bacterium]|nr:methyl-accepting chemotaxis protein [Candidatus Kapabacteria bacterium]